MSRFFVQRPVLSIVISLLLVLVGVISLWRMPVTQFPSIAPPEVTVTAEYAGANAEACVKAVVTPLERAINGVAGMKYMSSLTGNDGMAYVRIVFEVGTDPNVAAVNVQNRVSAILGELPEEVIRSGVRIEKEENSMLMYLNVFARDTALDEKFLYNFSDINIIPELKRITGVGFVEILGAREYAMRIWLRPDKMLAFGISPQDVVEAIRDQNVEAAPGTLGENSDQRAQPLQYVLKYTGRLNTPAQYESIPLKALPTGEILRLRDVANVEFSTMYYDVESKLNGRPSAAIALKQLPGSNASATIEAVKERLAELKEARFLDGMDYELSYDVSRFLDASIKDVIKTLIEAFILVALVVFLFLQDGRSTLIPILAVPVSLIGAFSVMGLMGFSINLITLFALVLAIGIVVDDAIVVVEAVHTKMEEKGLPVRQATLEAMSEISGAIIAITLVMAAVFIPVAFLGGPTGIFYRQFSVTMAVSIILSGIVALTLTPALCTLILKPTNAHSHGHGGGQRTGLLGAFFHRFNKGYNQVELSYRGVIYRTAGRRGITMGALLLFTLLSVGVGGMLPSGFIPNEDQGIFYANITTPAGSTLERTKFVVDAVAEEAGKIDAIQSVSTLAGVNILSDGTGATYGTCLINLKDWNERTPTVDEVMTDLDRRLGKVYDARIELMAPPAVPGYGNASGFELRLLDQTGSDDYTNMKTVLADLIEKLEARPEISSVFTVFDPSYPQYLIRLDMDRAAQRGVTARQAMEGLKTLIGSLYATNFIRFGQMYRVMVQALPESRANPSDLLSLYVKNNQGEMVPYSGFVKLERVYGLDQITRYNMYTSAEVTGEPAPGYSSGQAIEAIQEVASQTLPRDYDIDWAGLTRDQVLAGNQAIYIFLLSLTFVYLLLAAQYESFLLPLPVILSLPTGVFGAFLLLWMFGLENNIYAQVALVMLIGLLGKNAILIVEFALMRLEAGATVLEAAREGAVARLRPILMTSFAFIAGLLPLLAASGAGAIGNRTIGAAAAGGMLMGTAFGLILVPGLFVIFASMGRRNPAPAGPVPPTTVGAS